MARLKALHRVHERPRIERCVRCDVGVLREVADVAQAGGQLRYASPRLAGLYFSALRKIGHRRRLTLRDERAVRRQQLERPRVVGERRLQVLEGRRQRLAVAHVLHRSCDVELLLRDVVAPVERLRIDATHTHRRQHAGDRGGHGDIEGGAICRRRLAGCHRLPAVPECGRVVVGGIEPIVGGLRNRRDGGREDSGGSLVVEPEQSIRLAVVERLHVRRDVGDPGPVHPRVLRGVEHPIDDGGGLGVLGGNGGPREMRRGGATDVAAAIDAGERTEREQQREGDTAHASRKSKRRTTAMSLKTRPQPEPNAGTIYSAVCGSCGASARKSAARPQDIPVGHSSHPLAILPCRGRAPRGCNRYSGVRATLGLTPDVSPDAEAFAFRHAYCYALSRLQADPSPRATVRACA